jgi:hypothetical protein
MLRTLGEEDTKMGNRQSLRWAKKQEHGEEEQDLPD